MSSDHEASPRHPTNPHEIFIPQIEGNYETITESVLLSTYFDTYVEVIDETIVTVSKLYIVYWILATS